MTDQHLRDVNWDAATAQALRIAASPGAGGRRALAASVLSLGALHERDSLTALRRVNQACSLEPLNPLHDLRRALLLARSGQGEAAANIFERLRAALPESATLEYIRGVVALRSGKPKVARTIASSIRVTHPDFARARFLEAEAHLLVSSKPGSIEKHLMSLPGGPEHETLWADLLVKLVILAPKEGAAQAKKYLDRKIAAGSPAHAAVGRAMGWAAVFAAGGGSRQEQVARWEEQLRAVPPDSLSEELVLTCLVQRLSADGQTLDALAVVDTMRRKFPERPALGTIYYLFLNRVAVELASSGDYERALRLVERCLRGQPHDEAHYLNRAAIFTLLRRRMDDYHRSWTELNRHQYRLILLGTFDPSVARQAAQMHRVFSQQARIGVGAAPSDASQRCIFRTYVDEDGGDRVIWRVNEDRIASDGELLRQWIYHTQAELVFDHFLIGEDANSTLLHPADQDEAEERAAALCRHAEALGILVGEEGSLLATRLSRRWHWMSGEIRARYPAAPEPPEAVAAAQRLHLIVLGDLCLLCRQWQPSAQQLGLAEELLQFLFAERAFFAEGMLEDLRDGLEPEQQYPLLVLAAQARSGREDSAGKPLPAAQRLHAVDALAAELLVCMGYSALDAKGGMRSEQVLRALALIDRARQCNSRSATVELAAAEILVLGEFFAEARAVLDRFHRLVEPDEKRMIERAERLESLLAEKRKEKAPGRSGREQLTKNLNDVADGDMRRRRIDELEQELHRSPRAWKPYDEIVHELAKAERFDDAVTWADRAVAHCLTRAGQMNARALAIEARGLALLAKSHPREARLMAAGVAEPARKAIEIAQALPGSDYTLSFLLGKCLLAAGQPEPAVRAFTAALQACDGQLHRSVLRQLSEDIDSAYLAIARTAVRAALDEGRVDEAITEAAAMFGRLREPAGWLLDFAKVFYNALLARLGTASEPLRPPAIAVAAGWSARLAEALRMSSDAERAMALAVLAAEVHPASLEGAQALQERIAGLIRQIGIAEALKSAGILLVGRRFDDTLAFLASLEAGIADEPRFLRVRVLALLGLERFDDAEATMGDAGDERLASIGDFARDYPQLLFRHRLATAHRLLAQGKASEAAGIVAPAKPTTAMEQADLSYCMAYGLALQAYAERQRRRVAEARQMFSRAVDLIEPHLNAGSDINRFRELYDRLEKELEHG